MKVNILLYKCIRVLEQQGYPILGQPLFYVISRQISIPVNAFFYTMHQMLQIHSWHLICTMGSMNGLPNVISTFPYLSCNYKCR